jgi:hypothetical protein
MQSSEQFALEVALSKFVVKMQPCFARRPAENPKVCFPIE